MPDLSLWSKVSAMLDPRPVPFATLGLSAAKVLLALIFLANALAIVDQKRPVIEMEEAGVPARLAALAVNLGRLLQLGASIGLFVPPFHRISALALAGFLIPATLVAHAFWRAPTPEERGRQLTNFLKNAAMLGGLVAIVFAS